MATTTPATLDPAAQQQALGSNDTVGSAETDTGQSQDDSPYRHIKLTPLMVPEDFVAIPEPTEQFDRQSLGRRSGLTTIRGYVAATMKAIRGSQRPVAAIIDGNRNRIWVADPPEEEALYEVLFNYKGRYLTFYGRLYQHKGYWFIEHPEPIPNFWVGRPRPVYDLHGQTYRALERRIPGSVVKSCLVDAKIQNEYRRGFRDKKRFNKYLRESKQSLLEASLKDRESLYVALGVTQPRKAQNIIDHVLRAIHTPESFEAMQTNMARIRRMAAVAVIAPRVKEGIEQRTARLEKTAQMHAPSLTEKDSADLSTAVDRHAAVLPFTLTPEQKAAAREILADLDSGRPMRRVLSGDVGSGKTGVYVVAVAAMIEAGHRVAIILPSSLLANQVATKLQAFMPNEPISLIAGKQHTIDPGTRLWIGTVGVNNQMVGDADLVIVDEQQRFSRRQREACAADTTHLLEATATCIPRTQALMAASVIDVSRLQNCHVDKQLVTRIVEHDDRRQLLSDIKKTIDAGDNIIVVYPGKEPDRKEQVRAVKDYAPIWEKQFPGRVAVCHGGLDSVTNDEAVESVRSGDKQILVATSIVEVGIDVERMRRIVIVQPDRFGLATLHQMRGRVAREGGIGYCDLMLVGTEKARTRERLECLCQTTDGFELAEYDLELRGGGDAVEDGHRQSGQMPKSPFIGYEPESDIVAEVASELAEVYSNGIPSHHDDGPDNASDEASESAASGEQKVIDV